MYFSDYDFRYEYRDREREAYERERDRERELERERYDLCILFQFWQKRTKNHRKAYRRIVYLFVFVHMYVKTGTIYTSITE